jgi:hypothetical protein
MASSKTFYVTSVRCGYILAQQESGSPSGVVLQNRDKFNDEHKWTVEQGNEPNIIALRSVANGRYMSCPQVKEYAKVDTGDKQWWRISNDGVIPPGACRFSPVDSPDYALHWSGQSLEQGNQGSKMDMYKWKVCAHVKCHHILPLT